MSSYDSTLQHLIERELSVLHYLIDSRLSLQYMRSCCFLFLGMLSWVLLLFLLLLPAVTVAHLELYYFCAMTWDIVMTVLCMYAIPFICVSVHPSKIHLLETFLVILCGEQICFFMDTCLFMFLQVLSLLRSTVTSVESASPAGIP